MKKIISIGIVVLLIQGCSVNTSSNVDFDSGDITYVKDHKTGLCFAYIATRESFSSDASGMGLTNVPCEKVGK